jgi:hypothetical protein
MAVALARSQARLARLVRFLPSCSLIYIMFVLRPAVTPSAVNCGTRTGICRPPARRTLCPAPVHGAGGVVRIRQPARPGITWCSQRGSASSRAFGPFTICTGSASSRAFVPFTICTDTAGERGMLILFYTRFSANFTQHPKRVDIVAPIVSRGVVLQNSLEESVADEGEDDGEEDSPTEQSPVRHCLPGLVL